LALSTIVYESDICYVLVKEVTDTAVIMAVTKNKKPEVFSGVMNALTSEDFNSLKRFINTVEY
ncbi:MAG: hypothetical protein ACTSPS_19195, partial [Promethearchaeota archaeon]